MKTVCTALLLASIVLLGACGATKTDPSGTWAATLTTTQGAALPISFTDTLTTNVNQSNDPNSFTASITATNLKVTTPNGCVISAASQTGQYSMDATSNTFVLNLISTANSTTSTQLSLQGTLASNQITGNWTLSMIAPAGTNTAACTGAGTFVMKLTGGSGFLPRQG